MRRLAFILVCVAMVAGCRRDPRPSVAEAATPPAAVSEPAPPGFDRAAFTAAVDALAAEALARGPLAGFSIAVERGHDVLLAKGYGLADVEAGLPATADSSYPIASVSKNFTTAALFQLSERGRLDLDQPLGSVLEEARPAVGGVTLRHFLNHTSGIAVRGGPSPRAKAVRALRAAVSGTPGESFEYSNTGFALMGLVVEKASGLTYPQYIQQMVDAAGLTSTGYCEGGLAVPHRVRDYGVGAQGIKPSLYWQFEKFFAAGGLCSSVNDLLRWEHALDAGEVINAADRQAMMTPTVLPEGVEIGYGLGTRMGDTGGHRKLGHTGGGTSNKAVLAHYPDDGVTIAVLFNTEAYVARVTAMEVEDRVARLLFGLSAEPSGGPTLDLAQLQRYSGAYGEHGRSTRVVVDRAAQRLTAGGFGPLLPQGGDAFVDEKDPAVLLQFVTSGDRVLGYKRMHAGWFVQFGRRTGEAGPAPVAKKRTHRSRRARRVPTA